MRKVVVLALCALIAAGSGDAFAQGRRDRVRAGDVQTLDEIIRHVGSAQPGRFYDAEGPFPDGRGGYRYRLKWMTPEGRVIWLNTDARTGRVLGEDRGASRPPFQDYNRPNRDRDRDDQSGRDWRDRRDDDRGNDRDWRRRGEDRPPRDDNSDRRPPSYRDRDRREDTSRSERPRRENWSARPDFGDFRRGERSRGDAPNFPRGGRRRGGND